MRWRRNNPDKYREVCRKAGQKFNKTPKGIYNIIKCNSKKKNREFTLKQDEFIRWYETHDKVCHYCGIPQNNNIRLEIERMDNNDGYKLDNMTLACSDCNGVKGSILSHDEMMVVGNVIMRERW